jgi:DNA-binding MarR family transcriptional regulator
MNRIISLYRETRKLDRELEVATGLTIIQAVALNSIYESGALTLGELAVSMGVANSTTTSIADTLERKGWVERVRSRDDRRVVRLHLVKEWTTVAQMVAEVEGVHA